MNGEQQQVPSSQAGRPPLIALTTATNMIPLQEKKTERPGQRET
jgi:hypothetical protein